MLGPATPCMPSSVQIYVHFLRPTVKFILSRTVLAIGLSLAISINAVFFLLAVLLFWLPRWLFGCLDWSEHEAKEKSQVYLCRTDEISELNIDLEGEHSARSGSTVVQWNKDDYYSRVGDMEDYQYSPVDSSRQDKPTQELLGSSVKLSSENKSSRSDAETKKAGENGVHVQREYRNKSNPKKAEDSDWKSLMGAREHGSIDGLDLLRARIVEEERVHPMQNLDLQPKTDITHPGEENARKTSISRVQEWMEQLDKEVTTD